MPNSKPVLMVKCVVFILLLVLLLNIADIFLSLPETTARVVFHELYAQEEIDILLVGASRFRRDIDPFALEEVMGGNAFMVSFGSQTPIDNYYILKEAFKYYTPELVILDISYKSFFGEKELPPSEFIIPQMKFSLDKLAYMKDALSPEGYAEIFFPVLTENNRATYQGIGYNLAENYAEKRSEAYLAYDYSYASFTNSTYAGKGYLYSIKALEEGNIGRIGNATWKEETIDENMLAFYEKSLVLCAEKGVQVVMVDMPELYASIESQAGYDEYEQYISAFAEKHQVPFFNLGFLKTELFARKDSYFYDRKHLNYEGSQALSPVFGQILKEYLAGTLVEEKYFYATRAEMRADNPRIYNTWVTQNMEEQTFTARSRRGTGITPEYQFLYKQKAADEYQLLRDYAKKATLEMGEYTSGYIRVNCRTIGSDVAWEQYSEYKIEQNP